MRPTSSSSSSPTACSSAPAPGGEPFGEDGLRRALQAMDAPSANEAASAILQAVATTYDGPLRDDASVVVLAPV